MQYRVIPQDQWREELESFSRSHEGWLVRVAVTASHGQSQIEVGDTPLQGVTADVNRPLTITVMVGHQPETHLTHQVANARKLAFEQTEAGAISALMIWAGDGTKTAVEIQSPMRPEDVDGLPAGHAVTSSSRL